MKIIVDDVIMTYKESRLIMKNDGLYKVDFVGWFPGEFEGAIIHFRDFKYEGVNKPKRKRGRPRSKRSYIRRNPL